MDTPGLVDTKKQQIAATVITEALKQNGQYQIFFVVTLSKGRFRPEDLTTLWLVLLSTPDITVVNIIINKLSKGEYQSLEQKDGMVESNLIASLEMMGMRTKYNVFSLLEDENLVDVEDKLAQYPKLDNFVNKALWMHLDSRFVNDIPGDEKSFRKQLNSLTDKINHSRFNDLPREVRLVKLFLCYYSIRYFYII